jgi:hypothetical protein
MVYNAEDIFPRLEEISTKAMEDPSDFEMTNLYGDIYLTLKEIKFEVEKIQSMSYKFKPEELD